MFRYFLIFFSSFALALLFTPLIRILALKYGFIALPRGDRWHKNPTALLGGVAIYLAAVIPALSIVGINKNVFGLFLGATFLFLVGLADDKFHFKPYTKLFSQIIAGCLAIVFGLVLGLPVNGLFAVPLTILWIVAVTNSFNLLDNIDGLAAGIAAISAGLLFFSSLIFSDNPLAIYALGLSGAALGFLPYNFNPAKIFMGDSGSMFLGFCLAAISISGTSRHVSNFLLTMLIPVLILSVPIFDMIFVMIGRGMQGKKIFEGGKDHTSHRLVTLGISQRKTVILLYAISITFGMIALLSSRWNIFVISTISFLAMVILLFFGLFLFQFSSAENGNGMANGQSKIFRHKNENTVLNNLLFHKRRIVEFVLDLAFICIAYYAAYFLRFEGALLPANMALLRESLVWIILIKIFVFFSFGLYRGVWRYISISDFFTIFKVVSLGSIFSIIFLTFAFRFSNYSRAVFFIDWLLLLFLILGSRFLFRMVGEFLMPMRKGSKNIIIYGAGDTGEMVIREIKRNRSLDYNVVGFIDDDLSKIGNTIHGVSVLGSRDDFKGLVKEYDIKELIIAISNINADDLLDIVELCRECDIHYRKIRGILDEELV